MKSKCLATSSNGELSRCSASNWNSELKRMNWMPVWPKMLAASDPGEGGLHDAFGVRIAIVARIAQQGAVAAQQGEIHAPGVDADAVDRRRALPAHRRSAVEHFGVEVQHVPVQRVQGAHGPVGEAVKDFQAQMLTVKQAEDAPAALGAEVEGKQFPVERTWRIDRESGKLGRTAGPTGR